MINLFGVIATLCCCGFVTCLNFVCCFSLLLGVWVVCMCFVVSSICDWCLIVGCLFTCWLFVIVVCCYFI